MLFDIPIHYIRQYLFCTRIPFLLEVQKAKFTSPLWVNQGETHHKKQKKLINRRTLKRFHLESAKIYTEIPMHSDEYQIHGIADAILVDDNNVYPIEYKLHGKKPSMSQILQLVAYGVLAEKTYKKSCELGFILFEDRGKTYPIRIDTTKRGLLRTTITQLRESLTGTLPESPASLPQCTQCEFLSHCNDRE